MLTATPHLDRFLKALHRRLLVLRSLETIGLGLLAGCAASLLLMPILLWRHQSPLGLGLASLAIAAMGGLVGSLFRRPRLLDAAMAADRQLGLHDLLSTAWAVISAHPAHDPAGQPADGFADAVLAMADARCRDLAPSGIILARLGPRAWGGIGLAVALVLAIGLIFAHPADIRAAGGREQAAISPVSVGSTLPRPQATVLAGADAAEATRRPSRSGDSPESSDASNMSTASFADAAPNSRQAAGEAANPDGSGGGFGETRRPPTNAPRIAPLSPTAAREDEMSGVARAGSGQAYPMTSSNGAADGSGATAAAGPTQAVAPWASPNWPVSREQAMQAVHAGQVPDAYRDLVRDYFDRP